MQRGRCQCREGSADAERVPLMRKGRRSCGGGLGSARAPDMEVAVQRSSENVGNEHVYRDASVAWQESIIESTIHHLYPYISIVDL